MTTSVPTTAPNQVAMALRSLLDTNICIYFMKQQPPQVVELFGRCRVGEVGVSAITAVELGFGVAASGSDQQRNCEALDRFLAEVPVAPLDRTAALAYGPLALADPRAAPWCSRQIDRRPRARTGRHPDHQQPPRFSALSGFGDRELVGGRATLTAPDPSARAAAPTWSPSAHQLRPDL